MGEIRWSASLRSVGGAGISALILVPSLGRLIDAERESGTWTVLNLIIVAGMATILVMSVWRTVAVGEDGIAIRPGLLRLRWTDIERFDVRPGVGASIVLLRRDRRRASHLTGYGIPRARARDLVERLNGELSASRSG